MALRFPLPSWIDRRCTVEVGELAKGMTRSGEKSQQRQQVTLALRRIWRVAAHGLVKRGQKQRLLMKVLPVGNW